MPNWFAQMFNNTNNKDPPSGSTNAPSPSGSASGSDVRYAACGILEHRVSDLLVLRSRLNSIPCFRQARWKGQLRLLAYAGQAGEHGGLLSRSSAGGLRLQPARLRFLSLSSNDLRYPACVQFVKDPRSNEVVGLFGVFDGEFLIVSALAISCHDSAMLFSMFDLVSLPCGALHLAGLKMALLPLQVMAVPMQQNSLRRHCLIAS